MPRVVTDLLTGMHVPEESHYALLRAFVDAPLLVRATRHADAAGYLSHEFGDLTLVLRRATAGHRYDAASSSRRHCRKRRTAGSISSPIARSKASAASAVRASRTSRSARAAQYG
jgi:Queuosine biosynthesis protein